MIKQYITDESGEIQSVIINYEFFKQFEASFDDFLFGKILTEADNDEEISLDEAKTILRT